MSFENKTCIHLCFMNIISQDYGPFFKLGFSPCKVKQPLKGKINLFGKNLHIIGVC